MRKLKEYEQESEAPQSHNLTSMTNKSTGEADPSQGQAHEIIDNRIDEVEAHLKQVTKQRSITNLSSDFDSALSSAPPSLSPHPDSCPGPPVIWPKERDKNEEETELLLQELDIAKEQIKDLEQELNLVRPNTSFRPVFGIITIIVIFQLKEDDKSKQDRVESLEHKEAALIKELHELREQNGAAALNSMTTPALVVPGAKKENAGVTWVSEKSDLTVAGVEPIAVSKTGWCISLENPSLSILNPTLTGKTPAM